MDNTYSISEVAEKLNLSDKTLRRWEEAGKFSSPRTLGNQRRYTIEDLQILDAIKHGTIPDQKDLLTREQAALLLNVSPVTVDRYVAEGKIHPFITVGNTFFPRHVLEKKMAELKTHEPERITPLQTPKVAETSTVTPVKTLMTTPTLAISSPKLSTWTTSLLPNILITLALLTLYHFLFNRTTPLQSPTQPSTGSVQGASTISPQILNLVEDILDPSGNITGGSITAKQGLNTPNLSLLPGNTPASPVSGTVFYDASSQALKLYVNNSWVTLATTQNLQTASFNLESMLATLSAELRANSATPSASR